MIRRDVRAGPGAPPVSGVSTAAARGLPSALTGYLRTNWSRDPFSYGSYSFLAAGSGEADRAVAAAPVCERLFFAGEAFNPRDQSSVHAACESGRAAADAVLGTGHGRIAVIGAGMAWLAAAERLAGAGRAVVVLEPRERIGGRVWTDRRLGVPLDLGASWIHGPDGNPVTALAERAGAARVETDDSAILRGADGRQIWQLFAPDWIATVLGEVSLGASYEEMNQAEAQAAFDAFGIGYKGRGVIFPGGYDRVFDALAGDYEMRLAAVVRGVAHGGDGVAVALADGSEMRADAAIVTVPLGVLQRCSVAFAPALPPAKTAAIARMGMGTLDKLYLVFEEAFWDREVTMILTPETGLARGQFTVWLNFEPYLGAPALLAFNYGPQARALSGETDEALLERALGVLRAAYPG
ncbi:MAG: FAD-dependent oxidoreductase [Pseudomonadota bacterium]